MTTAPMNAMKMAPTIATAPARRDPRPLRLRRRLAWRRRLTVGEAVVAWGPRHAAASGSSGRMRWQGASTRPAARFGGAAEAARRVSGEFSAAGATPTPGGPQSTLVAVARRGASSTLRDVLRPAVLAVLVAVVVAGCGFKHEPTGALAPTFPITIHDAAGRPITLEHQPSTILVLDPAGARILKKLGAPATLTPAGRARLAAARAASRPPDRAGRHDDRRGRLARTASRRPDLRARRVPAACDRAGRGTARARDRATRSPGANLALALRKRRQELARRIASAKPQSVFVDLGYGYSIARDDAARDAGPRRRRAPGRGGAAPARLPEAPRRPEPRRVRGRALEPDHARRPAEAQGVEEPGRDPERAPPDRRRPPGRSRIRMPTARSSRSRASCIPRRCS